MRITLTSSHFPLKEQKKREAQLLSCGYIALEYVGHKYDYRVDSTFWGKLLQNFCLIITHLLQILKTKSRIIFLSHVICEKKKKFCDKQKLINSLLFKKFKMI